MNWLQKITQRIPDSTYPTAIGHPRQNESDRNIFLWWWDGTQIQEIYIQDQKIHTPDNQGSSAHGRIDFDNKLGSMILGHTPYDTDFEMRGIWMKIIEALTDKYQGITIYVFGTIGGPKTLTDFWQELTG